MSESYSIGVDLGGTNLRVASYRQGSGILETVSLSTRRSAGRDAVLADLCAAIGKLRATVPATYQLVGAGVATPGPMELPSGRLLDPPNLPGWGNFPLLSELQRLLRCDVKLQNDANVAALAEARLGLGKELGLDSLCMLTLGTGVGCGLVLKDSIWHGMNGMAGEAGHISFDPYGAPCACGTNGCLELSASATGLVKMARDAMSGRDGQGIMALAQRCPDFTAEDLFLLAAEDGDPGARKLFEAMGIALGRALASLVNTLNLPLYLIGGGVASAWPLYSEWMFGELAARSSLYRLSNPMGAPEVAITEAKTRVALAKLGSNSGLLGACLLPFN